MKPSRFLIVLLAALTISVPAYSQTPFGKGNKPQTEMANNNGHEAEAPAAVPLKILVVISEYDGTKKVASLPYTLYTVTERHNEPNRKSMRYHVRVPIATGSGEVNTQFQYQDLGTNIDYDAYVLSDDRYQVVLWVDHSWSAMPGSENKILGHPTFAPGQPMIPDFRDNFVVVLKNGQTVEGASAVDPVTGHVLKVDVTLTVLK